MRRCYRCGLPHKNRHGYCVDCLRKRDKVYYETHKLDILRKKKIYNRLNASKIAARMKKKQSKDKMLVIKHYDGECECCGERNIGFLTIDHANNDGNKHRKELRAAGVHRPSGHKFYLWTIKNHYPAYLRVQCFNCNCGRNVNGGVCPHKDKN